ncbi:MAG TPA: glycosyltransferase [Actinomycetota bacterium]|nr:glycosyltransferase [Actinomycetota bacterium]
MTLASLNFAHLIRLTDDTGLLEHARLAVPRRGTGYCVDDAARGLLVISREDPLPPSLARLGECYLSLLSFAQVPDGRCHNRLGYDRRWEDEAGLGDWWGRALWGLGTAAGSHADPWIRDGALEGFHQSAQCRSDAPRAMAFAALGAAEILRAHPGDPAAVALIAAAVKAIGPARPSSRLPAWPWPEPRLAYANAVFPEALIAAGVSLGDDRLVARGLDLLDWLLDIETHCDHLSVTPVGGWAPGDPRPAFDQQAIEVAALADACARAFTVSPDTRWSEGIARAVGWFLGNNDAGVAMMDPATGGGFDGLSAAGRNANQGAESTLALISTLQQSRRFVPSTV